MIKRHVGGEMVRGGVYWSIKGGEFIAVPSEGGKLEGGADHRYIKAPLPIVLVVGPVMGLAFAMFLPLSGLLVLLPFLGGKIRGAFSSSKVTVAHAAGSRMQPGLSYLEPGTKAEAGAPAADAERTATAEQDDRLVGLAEEIAEKRWQDK
jgi:hypothetical protein